MNKILCLCEVAALARDLQWENDNVGNVRFKSMLNSFGMSKENFDGYIQQTAALVAESDNYSQADMSYRSASNEMNNPGLLIDPNDVDRLTGGLSQSQRMKLIELLGAWYV
jgi:hypothetical protein